jgi:nucleotide-binding universal stress UspA family protein
MSDLVSRILVPIDFSTHSEQALVYAGRLAARLGASIQLLHVVDDPFLAGAWSPEVFVADPSDVLAELRRGAAAHLAELAERLSVSGAPVHTAVLTGHPARTIVEYTEREGIDLIVMGTHGRTGLSHALLGSVAERVVRRAPCAVLTLKDVPQRARHTAPQLAAVVV